MFTIRGFFEERQCQDKKYENFWRFLVFKLSETAGKNGNL